MYRICTGLSLLALLSSPLGMTAHAQDADAPEPPAVDAPADESAAADETPADESPTTDEATAAEQAVATEEPAATDEAPEPEPPAAAAPVAAPAFGDGEPLPEPEAEEDEAEAEESAISTAVWATAGIAAGSVVVGTVFGFLALSEQSSFEDSPTEDKADRGETYALLADVFLFTALASGVTALVLHYGRRSDDDEDEAEVAVDITPVLGRRAGGLSARMRF